MGEKEESTVHIVLSIFLNQVLSGDRGQQFLKKNLVPVKMPRPVLFNYCPLPAGTNAVVPHCHQMRYSRKALKKKCCFVGRFTKGTLSFQGVKNIPNIYGELKAKAMFIRKVAPILL